MFFTRETLADNRNVQGHWEDLWATRNIVSANMQSMITANRAHMTPEMIAANAATGFAREFWQEVDRMVVQSREETIGMEMLMDLLAIQTTLPIGKTVKSYNIVGDIADDVSITIDGQAPFSFDHTDYDSDGDPIPVFLAGFGVNWRHAAGLSSVGLDLVLDSQSAKMKIYNEKLVSYALDGATGVRVDSKNGQGLRNHRNTKKINLGASGANINLVTATDADLITFFTEGPFFTTAKDNYVSVYDLVWTSNELFARLGRPYIVSGVRMGTVMQEILSRSKIREFRPTYAMSGNEFLGYERKQSTVTPLVGMTTGITPLPRPMPNSNYNFQIMGAMGMQVKKDKDGRSGVVYGADMG
ncbi:hypothetical protein DET48_11431 [Vibrio diazotrophicus]|uniref:Coat protein n=1 Tax=Vibrio diazotrophicus TaxID=685 RepID=A0A329E935_VIBDI|nr:major capsid protein [Vibrio diazotrophicus]RAS62637.1 hypothetical protein DET48_11431 [Vibrio diazotrophicus]